MLGYFGPQWFFMARTLLSIVAALIVVRPVAVNAEEAIVPRETIQLLNGHDLGGLTTWLKDTHRSDPRKVFRVIDGMLHVSGEVNGYVATVKEYRDYRLAVEYM